MTLWAASAGAPKQLAQTQTGDDGRFTLSAEGSPDRILYLVATGGEPAANKAGGDNPAIALISVSAASPRHMWSSTSSRLWHRCGPTRNLSTAPRLRATRSVFASPRATYPTSSIFKRGVGGAIQDPLNGSQTPTMANFATLADLLSGCVTRVKPDACSSCSRPPALRAAAPRPIRLTAAESIALYPWYQPEILFALLGQFYQVSTANHMLAVPFMPYLKWAPSAWVLPLKFDGGGYRAGGKAMFDSEGNLWVGDNFTVGWQGQDSLWQGHATKFAPNGKPLSPITTGFTGGGMEGGTFGAAVDANDNAWLTNYGSKSITVFDKNGKPLTPPEGITFNGRLGLMQGVIVTPSGDVWVVGASKNQLVHFPKGDLTKGRIVCEGYNAEPCKSFLAPFHLGIDQHDRIWVTNAFAGHVTRFPAADPSKAEKFNVGSSPSGLAIDSQGNVWVTNRLGSGLLGLAHLADMGVHTKIEGIVPAMDYLTKTMSTQQGGTDGGSVTLLRPDGSLLSRFSLHRRQSAGAMGGRSGWR